MTLRHSLLALPLVLAAPAFAVVVTFQDGVAGYSGTQDTMIRSNETGTGAGQASPGDSRGLNFGNVDFISVDGDDGSPGSKPNHGLIRFDDIIGAGVGQIPAGATINSATLTVIVDNPGSGMTGHQVLVDWQELTATWNNFGSPNNGAELGVDISNTVLFSVGANNSSENVANGALVFTITALVQSWVDGTANYGIALLPFASGTNGIDFPSSESATIANRPVLTVDYTAIPEPATSALLLVLGAAGAAALRRRKVA